MYAIKFSLVIWTVLCISLASTHHKLFPKGLQKGHFHLSYVIPPMLSAIMIASVLKMVDIFSQRSRQNFEFLGSKQRMRVSELCHPCRSRLWRGFWGLCLWSFEFFSEGVRGEGFFLNIRLFLIGRIHVNILMFYNWWGRGWGIGLNHMRSGMAPIFSGVYPKGTLYHIVI